MEITCKYEGCESTKVRARGLCSKHYALAARHGEIPGQKPCSVDRCKGKAYARGLCVLHYERDRSGYGDHWCVDCNARIPARTSGGSYPDRCPPCQKERNAETLRLRKEAAAVAPSFSCGRCKQELSREKFYNAQCHPGGWCIACMAAYYRRDFDRTPKPCAWCGAEFTPKMPNHLFCSKAHKAAAAKARREGRNRLDRSCKACGADLPLTMRTDALYCSNACAVRMRNMDGRITPEMRRRIRVAKTYGLALEQYDALITAAGTSGCAICKTTDPGQKGWALDHCHTKGNIRGVLCGPCNLALGLFKDDPVRLRAAIAYLNQ